MLFRSAVATMASLFLLAPDLVGFTWYTAIGTAIVLGLGFLLSLRHRGPVPADETGDETARTTGQERP